MEIRYKRTYSPAKGKQYTAGEISAMLGYGLEIADPRVRLKEGKLAPGEVCLLLFGLTPEEYALKDSDSKAMDALAERLRKQVPADRLLGWRIIDLKGANVAKAVQVQTGESIDGGEFARQMQQKAAQAHAGPIDSQLIEAHRLQKLCAEKDASEETKQEWKAARQTLASALLNLDKLWIAMDAITGDRWPSIGFDGHIEIFTTIERAHRMQAQLTSVQSGMQVWNLRQITGTQLQTLLKTCAGDGLELLRIDNGFTASQLNVKDCVVYALEPNAALRSMMLREIQYGMRFTRLKEIQAPEPNVRGAFESMLTLRGFARREIGNGTLWALCAAGDRNKCVLLGGKENAPRMLAVFTTPKRAQEFAQKLNPAIKHVEMKFDELARHSEPAEGMLIDIGTIGYQVRKADYDQVRELRAKPPVIVRVQPAPQPKPQPKPEPEQKGSLPNPDDYDVPVNIEKPVENMQETPDQPEANPQSKPETQPERKGFLKKLFRK